MSISDTPNNRMPSEEQQLTLEYLHFHHFVQMGQNFTPNKDFVVFT